MIISTTPNIEGRKITKYINIVTGDAILGANIFKDLIASISDLVGGRSATYEREIGEAKRIALQEMIAEAEKIGANAVVGIDFDYETVGGKGSMLMVNVSGTAVILE